MEIVSCTEAPCPIAREGSEGLSAKAGVGFAEMLRGKVYTAPYPDGVVPSIVTEPVPIGSELLAVRERVLVVEVEAGLKVAFTPGGRSGADRTTGPP